MSMRRRGFRPADLTSLFDVLFILVFVSLVSAASQRKATAEALASVPAPAPPRPAGPPPALADLQRLALTGLGERPMIVLRVSRDGVLRLIETAARTVPLDVPVLEVVADADVGLAYLGERSAELRVCRQAALHLGLADLSGQLVVVAPDAPLADLPVALVAGLRRDADRCVAEQRGVAVLVDPSDLERTDAP
jgi:hypothetical protein